MKAEDFIKLIEQNRFDKISKNGMTLIAKRFRELQKIEETCFIRIHFWYRNTFLFIILGGWMIRPGVGSRRVRVFVHCAASRRTSVFFFHLHRATSPDRWAMHVRVDCHIFHHLFSKLDRVISQASFELALNVSFDLSFESAGCNKNPWSS